MIVAVFDGHNGRQAAEYCKAHVAEELARYIGETPSDPNESLRRTFLALDRALEEEVASDGSKPFAAVGTTAGVVWITPTPGSDGLRQMIIGGVGDTRVVLCQPDGHVRRLTVDHKADARDEYDRVLAAGGEVAQGRVMGIMAVARSLGDGALSQYVIAEPCLETLPVSGAHNILIIASDGLWDVVDDQEADNLISAHSDNLQNAALALVRVALERGSQDNTTVLLLEMKSVAPTTPTSDAFAVAVKEEGNDEGSPRDAEATGASSDQAAEDQPEPAEPAEPPPEAAPED